MACLDWCQQLLDDLEPLVLLVVTLWRQRYRRAVRSARSRCIRRVVLAAGMESVAEDARSAATVVKLRVDLVAEPILRRTCHHVDYLLPHLLAAACRRRFNRLAAEACFKSIRGDAMVCGQLDTRIRRVALDGRQGVVGASVLRYARC